MSIVSDRQGDIMDVSYSPAPRFDQTRFRQVLSHFATGVVIVTGRTLDGQPAGMTCQSFSSLSLDPPLVMVSPAKSSLSWPLIESGRKFAVNILGNHQKEISAAFARSGTDKFANANWEWSEHGVPLLTESIATVECDIEAIHDGGDHLIVVGSVLDVYMAQAPTANPLVFFRSGYRQIDGFE